MFFSQTQMSQLLLKYALTLFLQQKMASKTKVGYKCRIAGVVFLLLAGIAALVTVAVIQNTLKSQEYGLEVTTHTGMSTELCGCMLCILDVNLDFNQEKV